MALSQLPAPVKFRRGSSGDFYIWDGTFITPMYNLNDPALGLGDAINTVFADTLTPRVVTDTNAFDTFQDFLTAERDVLVQQIANAVNNP